MILSETSVGMAGICANLSYTALRRHLNWRTCHHLGISMHRNSGTLFVLTNCYPKSCLFIRIRRRVGVKFIVLGTQYPRPQCDGGNIGSK